MSVIAGVDASQTSVICFCSGFSRCPYYQGVRYSGVSAKRELTVLGEKKTNKREANKETENKISK